MDTILQDLGFPYAVGKIKLYGKIGHNRTGSRLIATEVLPVLIGGGALANNLGLLRRCSNITNYIIITASK